MQNCPYCGGKILVGVAECKHCGKQLGKKSSKSEEAEGLTNLKKYEKTIVPTWLMILLVGAALFCIYIMFAKGCQPDDNQQPVEQTHLYPKTSQPENLWMQNYV